MMRTISSLVDKAAGMTGGLTYAPQWLEHLYLKNEEALFQRINYYRFFYLLAEYMKPEYAIELGVEQGIAGAMMCIAGCKVIAIDHNEYASPIEIENRLPDYQYIIADTRDAWYEIEERVRGKVGIVFQDSSHHYDASVKEWELYSALLAPNAVWVCDDITPAFQLPSEPKGMVHYFNERPGVKQKYPNILHHGNTIGVICV